MLSKVAPWLLLTLLLAACWQETTIALPTAVATAVPLPTATPTAPPSPTPTAVPTATPMPPTATATPTEKAVATATEIAAATPAGQTCQEPPPRPVYRHRTTAANPWPTADPISYERLWLGPVLSTDQPPRRNEDYPYGYDGFGRYLLHTGLDLIEPPGTPVLAAAVGTVVVAQGDQQEQYGWRCDWYGQLVIIELEERWHDQPVYLLYGHLDSIAVTAGAPVVAGQPIGTLGASGATIGAHLHFELRLGANDFGATRNPSLWLRPPPEEGMIAGRLVDSAGRPWQGVLVTAVNLSAGAIWQTTWSYLVDPYPLANPDEQHAENFVLANLPAGDYQLVIRMGQTEERQTVTVIAGEISTVEFVIDP